jgi:hypothetical protein
MGKDAAFFHRRGEFGEARPEHHANAGLPSLGRPPVH